MNFLVLSVSLIDRITRIARKGWRLFASFAQFGAIRLDFDAALRLSCHRPEAVLAML
jgi:hypothetical protein